MATGDDDTVEDLAEHPAVAAAVHAITDATAGIPLTPPVYAFVFPILAAVLRLRQHTELHDEALEAVSLHVDPDYACDRPASLALLYHTIGTVPAYRHANRPLQLTGPLIDHCFFTEISI